MILQGQKVGEAVRMGALTKTEQPELRYIFSRNKIVQFRLTSFANSAYSSDYKKSKKSRSLSVRRRPGVKREIGGGVLVAGAAEELLIALEHTDIIRRIVPTWLWTVINHEIALALILVGLLLLWRREMKDSQAKKEQQASGAAASQAPPAGPSPSVSDSGKAILQDVGNPSNRNLHSPSDS